MTDNLMDRQLLKIEDVLQIRTTSRILVEVKSGLEKDRLCRRTSHPDLTHRELKTK